MKEPGFSVVSERRIETLGGLVEVCLESQSRSALFVASSNVGFTMSTMPNVTFSTGINVKNNEWFLLTRSSHHPLQTAGWFAFVDTIGAVSLTVIEAIDANFAGLSALQQQIESLKSIIQRLLQK